MRPYLTFVYKCTNLGVLNGREFIRSVRKLARKRGLSCRMVKARGKGSHVTIYLGDRLTVVKDRRKSLGPGLLDAMCKQLGLRRKDL